MIEDGPAVSPAGRPVRRRVGCIADRMVKDTLSDDGSRLAVRQTALKLLARREHSRRELAAKLRQRGYPEQDLCSVLDELEGEGLLSEQRFTEAYIASRSQRGYGPTRIRAELRERGVAGDIIEQQLAGAGVDWAALAESVRRKRFGGKVPKDFQARAAQLRYLQYRGFDGGQIREALTEDFD